MSSPPETTRYLCSQLVELFADRKTQWVNVEEIWREGVLLECEEPVSVGAEVAILAREVQFRGLVSRVDQDEFGWQVEIAFSEETLWSIEMWRPEHALNPNEIK